ncbi:MAG: DMT family transporter [Anaerolineae bacterium]|nr:DMT family transporter [Anaerolineae bacterium]
MSLPLVLSLISALATAIGRTLAKYVLRYTDTKNYLSVNFAVLFSLLIPLAPFFFEIQLKFAAIAALVFASTIDFAANYFYFKAFEIDDASTVSALLSLSPLFTLAVAPLTAWLIPVTLTWMSISGMLVTVTGIALLNRELRAANNKLHPEAKTAHIKRLLTPLIASALLGINAYTIKYIFNQEFMNPFTYYFIRLAIVAVIAQCVFKPDLGWVNRKSLAVTAGRGVFVIIQWQALLYALQLGEPPIVKAVSEISPLFTLGLSFMLLKEPITRNKVLGALLIIIGLSLIAI